MTRSATAYPCHLTVGYAHEHVAELLRAAQTSGVAAQLPERIRHRTTRRRPTWWVRIATRTPATRNA